MTSPQESRAAELVEQGRLAFNALDFQAAEAALTEALTHEPSCVPALVGMGRIRSRRYHDFDGAQCYFDAAVAFQPNNPDLWINRAQNARFRGDRSSAVADAKAVIAQNPLMSRAYKILDACDIIEINDKYYKNLENIIISPFVADIERASAHFVLGEIHERSAEYNRAFAHFQCANEFRREALDARARNQSHSFLQQAWRQALPLPVVGTRADAPRMIFVVGMPRSGSTLLEQILTTRPGVQSVGEASFFRRLWSETVQECYGETLTRSSDAAALGRLLTVDRLTAVRDAYLDEVMSACPGGVADVVVDKQLSNYDIIPLLASIFPNSKILHTTRHPLDVGMSCYSRDFAEIDFAARLTTIAEAYRSYAATMSVWREYGFSNLFNVNYEKMATAPGGEIRRLLEFVELPFDEDATRPERSANIVNTASASQVKKPINTSAVARWKKYVDQLEPLVIALGGWDWIEAHLRENEAPA